MANVFIDNIFEFQQYEINENEDVVKSILEKRNPSLDKRFFLKYVSASELTKYSFNDKNSIKKFRNMRFSNKSPIKSMGGCNYEGNEGTDVREFGIILSDPYKKIVGQFNINEHIMTYSPIFPFFYKQRDLIKFADDTYFTSISFETLLMNQIENATEYYIHIGNYHKASEIANYDRYIFERISKNQMIEYATNSELGKNVKKKSLKI